MVLEPQGPYVLTREDILFEILLQFNSTGGYLVMNTNFMVRLFFKCVLHLWPSFTKHKQAVNSHRIKSWSSCINNVNGKLVPANTKRVVWRPEMKDVTENHQLRAYHSKMIKNVLNISTIQICQVSKLEMRSYWAVQRDLCHPKIFGTFEKQAPAPIWPDAPVFSGVAKVWVQITFWPDLLVFPTQLLK